jgi:hypothetical protein
MGNIMRARKPAAFPDLTCIGDQAMRVTTSTHHAQQQLSLATLFWVEPLTILACISASIIVRTIAVTFFAVSASFQPL